MKRPLKELKTLTDIAQGVLDHMGVLHPDECEEDLFIELKEAVGSAKDAIYEEDMYQGVRDNAERWRKVGGR